MGCSLVLWDTRSMGIFDRFRSKAVANPTQALPLPLSQSRDIYLTGYGSGQLQSLLRRALPGYQIRYVLTGEYGEKNWRPHYHAALFGVPSLEVIEKTWQTPMKNDDALGGFVHVSGLGPESAAYIVSYILKRRNNVERSDGRHPEFKLQSLRPAIGLRTAQALRIPPGRTPEGVRLGGQLYPLGRYLQSQIRQATGMDTEENKAFRHRLAKLKVKVRDSDQHVRRVENAKTHSQQLKNRRRERQDL